MRFSFRLSLAFLSLVLAASASEITIVRVLTDWREGASFKRISEYFTGQENTGGMIVVRTHPEERTGFYFLVRLENAAGEVPVKFNLEVITPTEPKPKTFTFPATLRPGKNLVNLGLTADDWTDKRANPVAWKLEAVAADGRVLAFDKSYLWEQSAAK